ncbi:hypothetical protein FRB90_001038 [Tulasnella sp. 427]|nr:hypothetical protein FRB90_001038 [Tulasnella sp. 427]
MLEKDPILHLFNVYVSVNKDVATEKLQGKYDTREKANDYFSRLEQGNPQLTALWKRFRELSVAEYIKTYERLNVKFDVYSGESLVSPESIRAVVDQLEAQGLLVGKTMKESRRPKWAKGHEAESEADEQELDDDDDDASGEGLAKAIDFNAINLGKPVLQKPDGSPTYMVRDIAGAIDRYHKYHFDKMLYVAGDQQDVHFAQCFKVLSLLDTCPFYPSEKLEHVNFGKVKAQNTRLGEVNFLVDILNEAKETMMSPERLATIEDPEFTSDQIGMTAVKVQDMQAKRMMSYPFDLKRMTSFEGDTRPYLQYAHVRLCSMERRVALEENLALDSASLDSIDTSLLLSTPKARDIVLYLAMFPDVVRTALKTHEPCALVAFCFKLAHLISSAWETIVVKGLVGRGEVELAKARLLLYVCARDVLGSAMRMLSLTPLERM